MIKNIIKFTVALSLIISNAVFASSINKNPSPIGFDPMYNYWVSNISLLNTVSNQSIEDILKNPNEYFVFSTLFIVSKEDPSEARRIEAKEALSSFCYNYKLKQDKTGSKLNLGKCIDGTEIPDVLNVVNSYYIYKASKQYWETVAYNCIGKNFDNAVVTSYRNSSYGTLATNIKNDDDCSRQLSSAAYKYIRVPTENQERTISNGTATGVDITSTKTYFRDYVFTGGKSEGKRNYDMSHKCPSGSAQIDILKWSNFCKGTVNCKKRRKKWPFCVNNMHSAVYPNVNNNCSSDAGFYLKGKYDFLGYNVDHETMCKNWGDSGLSSSGNFFEAVQSAVIPNKNYPTNSTTTGGDSGQQRRFANAKKFYGGTPTYYGNPSDLTSEYRQFYNIDKNNKKVAATWSPTSVQAGTTNNKTGLYLINRSSFAKGVYSDKYETTQEVVGDMHFEAKYPVVNVDKKESKVLFKNYTSVYNIKNTAVHWLTTETDWIHAQRYTCRSNNYNYFNDSDVLLSHKSSWSPWSGTTTKDKLYKYTQKDMRSRILAKYGNASIPARALELRIKKDTSGVKPHSVEHSLVYNVCTPY